MKKKKKKIDQYLYVLYVSKKRDWNVSVNKHEKRRLSTVCILIMKIELISVYIL